MGANGGLANPVRMKEAVSNTQPRCLPSTSLSVANLSSCLKDISFILFISVILKLISMFIMNNCGIIGLRRQILS